MREASAGDAAQPGGPKSPLLSHQQMFVIRYGHHPESLKSQGGLMRLLSFAIERKVLSSSLTGQLKIPIVGKELR